MKRMTTAFCVAAAFGCIATLGAQTPTPSTTAGQRAPMADKARDVAITGCLSKGADGKFMLTNARVDNPMSDRSSTTTTGTPTTAGTTTTGTPTTTAGAPASTTTSSATASAPGAMNQAAATSWMLAGGADLDKHVGHTIQVTGRTTWENPMDRSRTPDTTTSAAGTPTSPVGTSGTTTTAAAEERKEMQRADQPGLDVQSIRMIAPTCS